MFIIVCCLVVGLGLALGLDLLSGLLAVIHVSVLPSTVIVALAFVMVFRAVHCRD